MSSPTDSPALESQAAGQYRIALVLAGLIAVVAGVLVLIWPGTVAVAITAVVALYAIGVGIIHLASAVFSSERAVAVRAGQVLLGLLLVTAGGLGFANLAPTTGVLAVVVTVFIGIGWVVDGIVALLLLPHAPSRPWTALYAVVTTVAGVVLLLSPLRSAGVLWWVLGVALVVSGAVQVVRGLTYGRAVDEEEPTLGITFEEDIEEVGDGPE